jgi:hypothetical protein
MMFGTVCFTNGFTYQKAPTGSRGVFSFSHIAKKKGGTLAYFWLSTMNADPQCFLLWKLQKITSKPRNHENGTVFALSWFCNRQTFFSLGKKKFGIPVRKKL